MPSSTTSPKPGGVVAYAKGTFMLASSTYHLLNNAIELSLQEFREEYPSHDAMYWIAANTTSEGRAARTFPLLPFPFYQLTLLRPRIHKDTALRRRWLSPHPQDHITSAHLPYVRTLHMDFPSPPQPFNSWATWLDLGRGLRSYQGRTGGPRVAATQARVQRGYGCARSG
jgi:hypothetical protein